VISIGLSTLYFAATRGPWFDEVVGNPEPGAEVKISDEAAFGILTELRCEEGEDGTIVHRMLDAAAMNAVQAGCKGIEVPQPAQNEE
jgi:hypothetical protein